jgi:hypothetical protein
MFPIGTASNHPIELPGVTSIEFESLLDFLYEGCVPASIKLSGCAYLSFRMHNEKALPLPAWFSLLSVSTRYDMKRIRSRAISEVSTYRPQINPVEQVLLAHAHNVPDWLPLAYAALCQREEAIEVDEAKKLGLETTVMLAKARETVRKISGARQTSKSFLSNEAPLSQMSEDGHAQVKPDPAPFEMALVRRVVDGIFWPTPALPKPELPHKVLDKSPCNLLQPDMPQPDPWSPKLGILLREAADTSLPNPALPGQMSEISFLAGTSLPPDPLTPNQTPLPDLSEIPSPDPSPQDPLAPKIQTPLPKSAELSPHNSPPTDPHFTKLEPSLPLNIPLPDPPPPDPWTLNSYTSLSKPAETMSPNTLSPKPCAVTEAMELATVPKPAETVVSDSPLLDQPTSKLRVPFPKLAEMFLLDSPRTPSCTHKLETPMPELPAFSPPPASLLFEPAQESSPKPWVTMNHQQISSAGHANTEPESPRLDRFPEQELEDISLYPQV